MGHTAAAAASHHADGNASHSLIHAILHAAARGSHAEASRPRQCLIWVDRHNHKNGGTTVRNAMRLLDAHGHAHAVPGWSHGLSAWHALLGFVTIGAAGCSADSPLHRRRMALEAHENVGHLEGWLDPLRRLRAHNGSCCRFVLTTRLRRPLDYYLSLYRWGVQPRFSWYPHERLFHHWAPPNMQAATLFWGSRSRLLDGAMHTRENPWDASSRDRVLDHFRRWTPAEHAAAARSLAADFELAYPLERYREAQPLLARLLELPADAAALLLDEARVFAAPRYGTASGGSQGAKKAAEVSGVCPNMTLCRARIAHIAPLDQALYDVVATPWATRTAES